MEENKRFKQDIFGKLERQAQETEQFYREAKEERLLFDTKLTTREAEIKEWTMKLLEENYEDFTRLLSAKSQEQENKMKTELASLSGARGDNDDEALRKLTIKESVENMGINLKNELLQLFEDDRRLKNIRFQEVYNLIESNKNLQTELIN